MSQTMEENESEDKLSWIWRKAVSVGKKFVTAGFVVTSAPLLVPPLFVVSTLAFISAVPFCFFLANYACTQKFMSSLLPATEETGGIEKDEYGFEDSKLDHGAGTTEVFYEAEPLIASDEPILIQNGKDEELAKESTRLKDIGTSEKDDEKSENVKSENLKSENVKSEKVQDQPGKQAAPETGPEGEGVGTTTQTLTGKDEKTYSNESIGEAVSAPHGTGEEKPKNTTKKKKKTGRAGVQ